jgi:hypothetical protein
MPSEQVNVKVEVLEDHLLIVFPRPLHDFAMPWQDAAAFGLKLEEIAETIAVKNKAMPVRAEFEAQQFRCDTRQDKYVVLYLNWSDRIRLSYEATLVCARTLRARAQDLALLERQTRISYQEPGRAGRPTPLSLWRRRIFGKH